MRKIVKPGLRFSEWICPDCGQIERITEDEEPFCSNCGTMMIPHEEKAPDPPPAEEPENPGTYGPSELPPTAPKKRGRKPKPKEGTCGTCASAMKSIQGYTCKIDCEGKREDDSCGLYVKGDPID